MPPFTVMAGLRPVGLQPTDQFRGHPRGRRQRSRRFSWMPGTSPGMTAKPFASLVTSRPYVQNLGSAALVKNMRLTIGAYFPKRYDPPKRSRKRAKAGQPRPAAIG